VSGFEDDHTGIENSRFQLMLQASIRKILVDETDPSQYLAWARESLPILYSELAAYDKEEASLLALWIARAIWSAMPLESNGYRPRPLGRPQRNEQCPCGSGKKYKQCCRNLPAFPEIPTDTIWPQLVECLSDKHWIDSAKAHTLPTIGLLAAAEWFAEHERWRSLKDLAEAAIGETVAIKHDELSLLVDPLCNAYDALYRTDRKKRALLQRLADHPLKTVRSAACQRLASWLHDQDEWQAAWTALTRAQQATPDDPAIAGLEISLLASEHAYDRARERAGYWLRRFEKHKGVPDEVLGFLRDVRSDPQRALADISRDAAPPPIAELLDWIDQHVHRPIPELAWSGVNADPDDAWLQDAYEPMLSAEEKALVDEWQSRTELGKPFSVQWMSGDEVETWLRSDDWLPWLSSSPQALDCFEILDDLIMLLFATEELMGLIENPWVAALVERGAKMLLDHWPEDRVGQLPWIITENRPALRILSKAILQGPQGKIEIALVRAYLRLNPSDNHGLRGMLVNELLQAGQDTEALQLAQDYKDDRMADILYGRVLALFRTGQRGEAINALTTAAEHRPQVLDFLIRDRVAKPPADPMGIALGGKGEAWLYRESMRDVWLAADGMLEWLKPLAKNLKSKRRI
jgi:hypothetical protein